MFSGSDPLVHRTPTVLSDLPDVSASDQVLGIQVHEAAIDEMEGVSGQFAAVESSPSEDLRHHHSRCCNASVANCPK
jgi:hypothetical protein